jgi:hypothetical protein
MLGIRIPSGPLEDKHALNEQAGLLAAGHAEGRLANCRPRFPATRKEPQNVEQGISNAEGDCRTSSFDIFCRLLAHADTTV